MSTNDNKASSSQDCPPEAPTFQRVPARPAEVGGIPIHRILPSRHRRTVGAWCFLDHAGPSHFAPGHGMNVGPHPHIGLQTFTWMLEGEVLHRDSLGSEQIIRPGQVNLMTAGRGISHTEESLADEDTLHATQLWIALPPEAANCDPAFDHHPDLPVWSSGGCDITLLAGSHQGRHAPARLYSPLVGMDVYSAGGGTLVLPLDESFEYGVLPLEGSVHAQGEPLEVNELAYVGYGRRELQLNLAAGARAIVLGSEPCKNEILIWWNFVGHDKATIAQAQRDWEAGSERFGTVHGYSGPPMTAPPLPWVGV